MTVTRRLAAISAADVAGYSRLIGTDEGGTLGRLKAIRAELVDISRRSFQRRAKAKLVGSPASLRLWFSWVSAGILRVSAR
jgi:hypothetical protein